MYYMTCSTPHIIIFGYGSLEFMFKDALSVHIAHCGFAYTIMLICAKAYASVIVNHPHTDTYSDTSQGHWLSLTWYMICHALMPVRLRYHNPTWATIFFGTNISVDNSLWYQRTKEWPILDLHPLSSHISSAVASHQQYIGDISHSHYPLRITIIPEASARKKDCHYMYDGKSKSFKKWFNKEYTQHTVIVGIM